MVNRVINEDDPELHTCEWSRTDKTTALVQWELLDNVLKGTDQETMEHSFFVSDLWNGIWAKHVDLNALSVIQVPNHTERCERKSSEYLWLQS